MMISSPVRQAFARPEMFVLEARSSSLALLASALDSFRHSIFDIGNVSGNPDWPGPAWVSDVMQTPSSCLLMLDLGEPPRAIAEEIVSALARVLARHGVPEPSLRLAKSGGPFAKVQEVPNGVILRAYPAGGATEKVWPFDKGWIDEALKWIGPGDPVACSIISIEFSLSRQHARRFLEQQWVRKTTEQFGMFVGDVTDRVGVVKFFTVPAARPAHRWANLFLAAGGPSLSGGDLIAPYRELIAIGRRLAERSHYVFIDFVPTLVASTGSLHDAPWKYEGGASSELLDRVRDVLVFDGFPWQVIGPGHLQRLGSPPEGAVSIGNGKFELSVGEPEDWLRMPGAKGVRQRARELLAACLPRESEAMKIAWPPKST